MRPCGKCGYTNDTHYDGGYCSMCGNKLCGVKALVSRCHTRMLMSSKNGVLCGFREALGAIAVMKLYELAVLFVIAYLIYTLAV